MSPARSASCSRVATRLQERVADGVAQRVVDLLEAVQVEQTQGQRGGLARRGHQALLEPVVQHGAVGQAGERVVQSLVLQRRLRLRPGAHVAARSDQAAHRGIVQEIVRGHVEGAPGAVGVTPPERHLSHAVGRGGTLAHPRRDTRLILGVDQGEGRRPLQRAGGVAQHARIGGAGIADEALGVGDGHQIGGILGERPEAFLARTQRLLGLHPRGDIAAVDDEALDDGIVKTVGDDCFEHAPGAIAVLAPVGERGHAALAGGHILHRGQRRVEPRQIIRMHEVRAAAPLQLRGADAQHALMRGTGVATDAGAVEDQNEVGGMLGQRPVPGRAPLQRRVGRGARRSAWGECPRDLTQGRPERVARATEMLGCRGGRQ